jgi:hypothetical protein
MHRSKQHIYSITVSVVGHGPYFPTIDLAAPEVGATDEMTL